MSASTVISCPPPTGYSLPFSSLGGIDRIGEAFCQSRKNLQRIADVQRYRAFRMRCLDKTLSIVNACHVPVQAIVSVRLKRLDSIRGKLNRVENNFKLGRLDDVVGVRVICEDLSTVKEFSRRIESSCYFSHQKDYIADPLMTGYRGIHHVMKFPQPISKTKQLNMRFEIQVRTYLQHLWAVWSESLGEAVKIGKGSNEERGFLHALSEEVAKWESVNPNTPRLRLPSYSSGRSIVVCWRPRSGRVIPYNFPDGAQRAVDWLSNLEVLHPGERENALLLVGVTKPDEAPKLLRLTHPKFTGARAPDPKYWRPGSSS